MTSKTSSKRILPPRAPAPMTAAEEAAADKAMRIRSIQFNHERAVQEIKTQIKWLRDAADDAERNLDGAHTPGNITATAGRLDAAREKAWVLRETLKVLGADVKPEARGEGAASGS